MELVKQYAKRKAQAAALAIFLKIILPILLFCGLIFGVIFMILAILGGSTDSDTGIEGGQAINLSSEVLSYKPDVEKYASEYGVEEHVGVILALMMQESGGRGNDPMQASESLCGAVGCIDDPDLSIEQGVKYFSGVIERADGDIKLALQSYNFGGGFIDYVMDHGGSYSQELAIDFSAMKYQELKHTGNYSCIHPEMLPEGACYGDVYYVDNVLRYYDYAVAVDGNGEFAIPIQGALDTTSEYGMRYHPLSGEYKMHTGIDFACVGSVTPIYAAQSGKVVYSQFQGAAGYGNLVMIQHGDQLISAYAHLSSLSVDVGDTVKQGQKVGVCGTTGSSTGPHLHLEMKTSLWDGHMNPAQFFGLGES